MGREVIVAGTAGFCFGVRRAVQTCYEEADRENGPVYTFGPIIHNEEVVRDLEQKGITVLNSMEEMAAVNGGTVIIRSHGVGRAVYEAARRQGLRIVDATCPFVKKIHRIVEKAGQEGKTVLIIGDPQHPEVQGIMGWAAGPVSAVQTEEEARAFAKGINNDVCIVSQTTFNHDKFHKLVEIIKGLMYHNYDIVNTICNATEERQTEARAIARRADAMIVIGGKHSSNTRKLYEICREECAETFYIQSLADLELRLLPSMGCVGITAGASTPNNLIEEVSKQCQK